MPDTMMNKDAVRNDIIDTLDIIETKTCNSSTSLLPLYIYNIIKNESSYDKPVTTKKIVDIIINDDILTDYELKKLPEKTIRRIVYTLIENNTGVVFKGRTNTFYYTRLANNKSCILDS